MGLFSVSLLLAVGPLAGLERSPRVALAQPETVVSRGPHFAIEPYVLDLSTTEARLAWRRSVAGPSVIEYGYTVDLELGRIETPAALQHSVRLSGLVPGSTVHYLIDRRQRGSLRLDRDDGYLRFGLIGHTHGTEQFGHYPDTLLVARLDELDLDFVVHAGDSTFYSDAEGFGRWFFEPFRRLLARAPVYMAPGNHDSGWPFVDGVDLGPFKELFPHAYPEAVAASKDEACFAVEKGSLQLLFLAYVSLDEGVSQRSWLRERLESSEFDFSVVVYGGGNAYFDEEEFLDWLSQFPVDCVFNGDSIKRKKIWREEAGLEIAFVGTGGSSPHPLLYAELRPGVLVFRGLDASGNPGESNWIYTRRERPRVAPLQVGELQYLERRKTCFVPLRLEAPVPAAGTQGLQLRFRHNGAEARHFYVHAFPTQKEGNGVGFQTESYRLRPSDRLVSIPLPSARPGGDGYDIKGLRVSLNGVLEVGEVEVLEAWLY